MAEPEHCTDAADCARLILQRAGRHLRIAAPLGLGKPNAVLNALYALAKADAGLELELYTALSLARPQASAGLEGRFLGPFVERHFGADYPDLDYVADQLAGRLPANVRIHEFYLQSGALLACPQAQRDYVSENYTHVARDMVPRRINVVVQLVAMRDGRVSLSCNPDVTLDLLDRMREAGQPAPMLVGVVHPDLPFLGHDAEVAAELFDVLLPLPAPAHALFAVPREPVDDVEYAIGYHASTLVRDGGTLQIGIGALSDALVHALLQRQRDNAGYRKLLAALDNRGGVAQAAAIGGLDVLDEGLYGASEMLMDGLMQLRRAGILSREAYDDEAIERAVAAGAFEAPLQADCVAPLLQCGVLPWRLGQGQLQRLQRFGLLPDDARCQDGCVVLADGTELDADLAGETARAALGRVLAGRRLRGGRYLRSAFYLGSTDLYAWLRSIDGADWEGLDMTRVSDVNQLYGGREKLDALQRRGARFFNTCMMATALGAVVSDALEDGRVVSGVGGQYNFVAMAHELDDGRSVLLLHATRSAHGKTTSNIRWNYGHTTIPRHLRDIVVTEYGVADLRGRSDEDCIKAMLAITDARFVDALAATARRNGKLARDFRVPDACRANTPERIAAAFKSARGQGKLPAYPMGCDFDPVEQRLLPALAWLREQSATKAGSARLLLRALLRGGPVDGDGALLERMDLAHPADLGARVQRRLLRCGLRAGGSGLA